MNDLYEIVRFYSDSRPPIVMNKGLSLDQAQEHCQDPETSSTTANCGRCGVTCDWFEGYREQ